MNVYRIEVKVAATMYVKASSEAEARRFARNFDKTGVQIDGNETYVPVSGKVFDDPDLPVVSLAPWGELYLGKMKTVEIAEEDV
ncbi:MAG: hypothetical protein RJA94_3666 [Pseudomonadota bacterium]|jgi:hypothetical protein